MNTRQILILFLCLYTLPSCVDLKKPPSVENCSSLRQCTNMPVDAGKSDVRRVDDVALGDDSEDYPSDSGDPTDVKDAPDTPVTSPDLLGDSNVKVDTVVTDRPPLIVEPPTGVERGAELPVEPRSQDTRPSQDTNPDTAPSLPDSGIPDTRIPDTNPPDTFVNPCPVVYVRSGDSSLTHSGLGAYCILTCDILEKPYFGWGCYNDEGRTVKINGKTMRCGDTNLPDRVNGHYLFEISAGTNNASAIAWWGQETISNCPYKNGDPIP